MNPNQHFKNLLDGVGLAPGNDDEIDALRCLLRSAFDLLPEPQRQAFFEENKSVAQQAKRWEKAASHEDHGVCTA
jgi:hypothetical protein